MNTTVPEMERRVTGHVVGVGMHVQRISIVYETEVGRATQVVKQWRDGHAGPIGALRHETGQHRYRICDVWTNDGCQVDNLTNYGCVGEA
jgi:hypothetical protein